jgi:hypothetical protein
MEVYLPGAGWVEFDPTNGIIGSERLIRVAVARDPEQAMPIKGTFTGAADVQIGTQIDVQVKTLAPTGEPVAPPSSPMPLPEPEATAQASAQSPSPVPAAGSTPLTQS